MFWGFIFIFTGVGLFLQSIGFLPQNASIIWPIILIALGLSIIFKKRCCWDFWDNRKNK